MHATIIGSTGLIGTHLLNLLINNPDYSTVRILIRRPVEFSHPKLEKKLVDFNDMESFRLALEGTEVIFCCIGTTMKKMKGDKEAYRKIDYDIAVQAAQLGKACGCEKFVLVSAVGADSNSRNFYLKLKGETEEAVQASGIESVYILRPSLLIGNRKEFRAGEKLATWLMPLFAFLLPARYRPVKASEVAKAMVNAVKDTDTKN
ncbi:MAG TPA: NAD(P)H-binding protein [Chitinophagaceae bacterium]|nr:NAD(P)H-binding protein [Chitinophagaceae bacterium]